MLAKLDYLRVAIAANKIEDKTWYYSCFGIPLLKEDPNWEENAKQFDIVTRMDGLYYVDSNPEGKMVLEKITDYVKDQPLYRFQDVVTIDPSWGPFAKSKMETKIGVLIINALILYPSFKGKLEYMNTHIKISDVEKVLAQRVVNDSDAKEGDISVSEMVKCFERFAFLSNLANIINIASTAKAITPPTDIKKIKAALLKEYEGQLHDPVKLVEFEQKLIAIDNEYLADDPTVKNIFNGKARTGRKKMFLVYGDTMDFEKTTSAKTIAGSLSEGLSTDPNDFPKYMNDLRVGSFARGGSTQLGGYTYKILQRSLSSIYISSVECNTKRGLKRVITPYNVTKLLNRYVALGGKWTLIETIEEAKKLMDKEVMVRSSMYCTSPKNTVCYKCMNEMYKDIPTGVTNIASELSGTILGMFMKLTHGKINESTTINMKDLIT